MDNFFGMEVYEDKYLPEQMWFNTKLNKWVQDKYLSRTKHKELRDYIIVMGGRLVMHPNILLKLKSK